MERLSGCRERLRETEDRTYEAIPRARLHSVPVGTILNFYAHNKTTYVRFHMFSSATISRSRSPHNAMRHCQRTGVDNFQKLGGGGGGGASDPLMIFMNSPTVAHAARSLATGS